VNGEPARHTIRVAIVDDHPMVRMGLTAAINEMAAIELVGEAERADQVRDLVTEQSPDVLLLDVRLPDGTGLDVVRWLAEHCPDVKVIMLTMSEDFDTATTALSDGARGYLVKGVGPERLEHSIRAVHAGAIAIDETILPGITHAAKERRSHSDRPFPQLTQREFDILDLMAAGLDNASIARQCYVHPKTVRNHVSNIFAKIQVRDRSAAIVMARQKGLGNEPTERN
jgi:DNA-binding NarL/FixJ family response regulator